MATVLVTGANRGLGLEFATQYAKEGWTVHACCRFPGEANELSQLAATHSTVNVHALDVSDFDAIDALAKELEGTAIDVLINNAGVFGPKPYGEDDNRQQFGHMDFDIWNSVFRINTQAPFKMAQAFLEHVKSSGQKKIVSISSTMGSIEEAEGGLYAYRTSKCSLTMVMRALSQDLKPHGIAVAAFCPGWVATRMGSEQAPIGPDTSIEGLRARITELSLDTSGRFTRYNGEIVPF